MRRRYGEQFYSELEAFEQGKYNPVEELDGFLEIAKNVPYYKESFEANQGRKGEELLAAFPILSKADVKANLNAFVNEDCTEPKFEMRTSGTTGGGLVFPYTVLMENKHWAIWWRYRRRLGIDLDTWCGWFGGKRIIDPNQKRAPYWRINKPGRQVMFSTLHLTKETVCDFHQEIKKRELPWLHGYPSHIAKFAAFALDAGLDSIPEVKWITTRAENLLGNQMSLMQQMFPNAMIRQHYGLMEGVANMSQNREGEWLIDDDFAKVEFIPVSEDNPNVCRIIGTGFSNPAFPLLRYDTGDIATIEKNQDGRVKVLRIDGRSSNVLKGPDGLEINEARLSIVLRGFNNIVEAQFIQHSLTDIDLLVVRNSKYNEDDERKLQSNIAECFDKRMTVNIIYKDMIERPASGKLKLVVNAIQCAENQKNPPPRYTRWRLTVDGEWLVVNGIVALGQLSVYATNNLAGRRAA